MFRPATIDNSEAVNEATWKHSSIAHIHTECQLTCYAIVSVHWCFKLPNSRRWNVPLQWRSTDNDGFNERSQRVSREQDKHCEILPLYWLCLWNCMLFRQNLNHFKNSYFKFQLYILYVWMRFMFLGFSNLQPFWIDASPSGDNWIYSDGEIVPRNPPPKQVRPVTNCIIAVANGVNNSFGWSHATCSNKYNIICEMTVNIAE